MVPRTSRITTTSMPVRTISRSYSARSTPQTGLRLRTITPSVDNDEEQISLPPTTTAVVLRKEVK